MPVISKPLVALPTVADLFQHRRLKTLPDTESICAQHAAQPKIKIQMNEEMHPDCMTEVMSLPWKAEM
ncbi:hypothetical protein AVEN_68636-1 [Araneus ventricosus]|uniref:Uncharacterized protein n=1 Tax=Araneus ventricosus TaxID=182803 RepID=A0A4Y2QLU9_ARAVE|nr:hypothetical protein AVEN_68636-1 [Araneus ventricosus]